MISVIVGLPTNFPWVHTSRAYLKCWLFLVRIICKGRLVFKGSSRPPVNFSHFINGVAVILIMTNVRCSSSVADLQGQPDFTAGDGGNRGQISHLLYS